MAFAPLSIRLLCDQAARFTVIDINTGQAPVAVCGDNINFEVAIGLDGAIQTGLAGTGAGGVASITLQLFESEDDTNPPQFAQTIAAANINFGLTQAEWNADTTPFNHAIFKFTPAVTSLNLGGAASDSFWLRIFITTSDAPAQTVAILEGAIQFRAGPVTAVAAPTAAYLRFSTVNGNIVPQLYDPVSQLFYNLEIDTVGGVRTLSLGDTGYN